MSKKRFLSIVISAVMILSLACSALAVGQSGRYIGNSTVNGSIYQTYYQVDAQTRTGIKSISVSGTLYEKGTFGTWQRVMCHCQHRNSRTRWPCGRCVRLFYLSQFFTFL